MDWLGLGANVTGCLDSVVASCREWLPQLLPAEEVVLGTRRFRIVRLLGEGGYSFVYLVAETTPGHDTDGNDRYALKKVQAASRDQLEAARFEIAVMSRLRHPNLLPLLASQTSAPSDGSTGSLVAYMLFPLYSGSLADLAERLAADKRSLPAAEVVHIFIQVARGLQAMHGLQPRPLIHRDVKPHNVLLRARSSDGGHSRRHGRYQAVLMDFGSVQDGRRHVESRADALAMQEEAERHATAPYRAPELWDVPSECTIDERVDSWSLGCLLYFMMYGVSPFERVLNEAGGSLMLAVINNAVSWPPHDTYPEELRTLVKFCLNSDPATRPFIDDILSLTMTLTRGS